MPSDSTQIFESQRYKRHGLSHSPEYQSWGCMVQRCLNPKHKMFVYYGGRGITIYPEWIDSFKSFYDYIGPKPTPKHTLDRINNEGNYEPGNVRWATRKEQVFNRRHWAFFTYNGETLSVTQWAKRLNVNYHALYTRLKSHSTEQVLSGRIPIDSKCIGESHPGAVLTVSKVQFMRALYLIHPNYSKIGRLAGISKEMARKVITRQTWKHVN